MMGGRSIHPADVKQATEPGWAAPCAVFSTLEGAWTFERTIAGMAEASGTARFTRQGTDKYAYRESAQVKLANGRELQASREYFYRRHAAGFDVWFAEEPPRLFHLVRLTRDANGLRANASHLCGLDHYRSRYAFLDDGSFVVEHRVEGPAKDYLIATLYRRPVKPPDFNFRVFETRES